MVRMRWRRGRINLAAGVVLVLSLFIAGAPAQAGTGSGDVSVQQQWICDFTYDYVIHSDAALKYVSAELGSSYTGGLYGMLRARTDYANLGPWEKFTLCRDITTGYAAFRAYGGRWVQAEYNYPGTDDGMLRAPDSDGWPRYAEQFMMEDLGFGQIALKNRTTGRYVSAELSASGLRKNMLRARATVIGPWEVFSLL